MILYKKLIIHAQLVLDRFPPKRIWCDGWSNTTYFVKTHVQKCNFTRAVLQSNYILGWNNFWWSIFIFTRNFCFDLHLNKHFHKSWIYENWLFVLIFFKIHFRCRIKIDKNEICRSHFFRKSNNKYSKLSIIRPGRSRLLEFEKR